jgi:putative flippase GtrA
MSQKVGMRMKNLRELRTFMTFALVGIMNTLIDWGIFWLTYSLAEMHYLVAQTLAYACGMINSYVLNKSWTFKVKNKANPVETGKFVAVNVICLSLSYLLLYGWNSFVGEYMLIGKAAVTAVLMVLNYLLSKQWVFKTNEESASMQNDWE